MVPDLLGLSGADRGYRNSDSFGYNSVSITLVVSTLGARAHRLVLSRPQFF